MYIIIIGCGRLGSNLAKELSDFGHDICIIDRDKEKLAVLGSGFNGQKINSIEFDSDNLVLAGIKHADALMAVTQDDNINITVSLIANQIYHVPQVIARANDPKRKYIYEKLDIDTISPVQLGVDMLFDHLTLKNQEVLSQLDDDFQIVAISVNKKNFKSSICDVENKYNCIISAIRRGASIIMPKNDETILNGDKIYCTIKEKEKENLIKLFSKESSIWNQ